MRVIVNFPTSQLLRRIYWLSSTDTSEQHIGSFPPVNKYQHTLRNNAEERRPHLHRGGILKYRTATSISSRSLTNGMGYLMVVKKLAGFYGIAFKTS